MGYLTTKMGVNQQQSIGVWIFWATLWTKWWNGDVWPMELGDD
jgi:hypothetical protein